MKAKSIILFIALSVVCYCSAVSTTSKTSVTNTYSKPEGETPLTEPTTPVQTKITWSTEKLGVLDVEMIIPSAAISAMPLETIAGLRQGSFLQEEDLGLPEDLTTAFGLDGDYHVSAGTYPVISGRDCYKVQFQLSAGTVEL